MLWLLPAIATGTFLGLLAADWLNWQGGDVLPLAGAGTALYGGVLCGATAASFSNSRYWSR